MRSRDKEEKRREWDMGRSQFSESQFGDASNKGEYDEDGAAIEKSRRSLHSEVIDAHLQEHDVGLRIDVLMLKEGSDERKSQKQSSDQLDASIPLLPLSSFLPSLPHLQLKANSHDRT